MMTFMCGMPCLVFAQDQRVTIHVTNVDIQVVFKQIKEQANLNFVYNADQLKEMMSAWERKVFCKAKKSTAI